MENLEMVEMKEITKEMAIKAAAAAMANYFSDLYLKDKEFKEGRGNMDLKA